MHHRALIILPGASFEVPFDIERLTLRDVFVRKLTELAPDHEVVELSLRLAIAFGILPEAIRREAEGTDGLTSVDGLELRVVRDVPEERDSIHRFHRKWGKEVDVLTVR